MIYILLVDDHAIFREGLKKIIENTSGMGVTGEANNGQEALDQVWKNKFDLVILDISLPGRSGLEILKEIKKSNPQLPVLILSMHSEDQYARRLLKAGASGYLKKDSAFDELVNAIRTIHDGHKYISPVVANILAEFIEKDADKEPHELLSDREFQVLCMIGTGKTVTEISKELSLSDKTISTYRARILEKMRMRTNADLTFYAISNKLVKN
mgnify:CR=1 FL=1